MVEDIKKLENELDCFYKAEPLKGFFLDIVKSQINIIQKDIENYLWYSFWLLKRKSDKAIVGLVDFKKTPINGNVEIGYGLGENFEHRGYMTEAVTAMCNWSLKQNEVFNIIAETEKDGVKSQNVLKHCGFKLYKESETLWWKL